eukprot:UN31403
MVGDEEFTWLCQTPKDLEDEDMGTCDGGGISMRTPFGPDDILYSVEDNDDFFSPAREDQEDEYHDEEYIEEEDHKTESESEDHEVIIEPEHNHDDEEDSSSFEALFFQHVCTKISISLRDNREKTLETIRDNFKCVDKSLEWILQKNLDTHKHESVETFLKILVDELMEFFTLPNGAQDVEFAENIHKKLKR